MPSFPEFGSEQGIRAELFSRTREQEAPPDLTADPAHKWRIVSALQKSVRRGHVDNAVKFAALLHSIDPAYVWRRLAVIALEDVGFGDPVSAAVALEANRSYVFRQKLGERLTLATATTGLADAVKSRSLTDKLLSRPDQPYPSSSRWKADIAALNAPFVVRYLALRGFSHARLGAQVPDVWPLISDETEIIQHETDPLGDELIEGIPAAAYDIFSQEGRRALAYFSAYPPARQFLERHRLKKVDALGMAVFATEGGLLDRSISNLDLGALEIEAQRVDWQGVGVQDTKIAAQLMALVRDNRELLNRARRRILQ